MPRETEGSGWKAESSHCPVRWAAWVKIVERCPSSAGCEIVIKERVIREREVRRPDCPGMCPLEGLG